MTHHFNEPLWQQARKERMARMEQARQSTTPPPYSPPSKPEPRQQG